MPNTRQRLWERMARWAIRSLVHPQLILSKGLLDHSLSENFPGRTGADACVIYFVVAGDRNSKLISEVSILSVRRPLRDGTMFQGYTPGRYVQPALLHFLGLKLDDLSTIDGRAAVFVTNQPLL
jgi:hypothetical protein